MDPHKRLLLYSFCLFFSGGGVQEEEVLLFFPRRSKLFYPSEPPKSETVGLSCFHGSFNGTMVSSGNAGLSLPPPIARVFFFSRNSNRNTSGTDPPGLFERPAWARMPFGFPEFRIDLFVCFSDGHQFFLFCLGPQFNKAAFLGKIVNSFPCGSGMEIF